MSANWDLHIGFATANFSGRQVRAYDHGSEEGTLLATMDVAGTTEEVTLELPDNKIVQIVVTNLVDAVAQSRSELIINTGPSGKANIVPQKISVIGYEETSDSSDSSSDSSSTS